MLLSIKLSEDKGLILKDKGLRSQNHLVQRNLLMLLTRYVQSIEEILEVEQKRLAAKAHHKETMIRMKEFGKQDFTYGSNVVDIKGEDSDDFFDTEIPF